MNLPNKLSLLRICMVPLFVAAYFLPYYWGAFIAVGIFLLAAFTDFLDGHIARKYGMVTDLGKLLDPIADKILVCAALFCVVATNPLQYYYEAWAVTFGLILLAVGAAIILSRELLISAVRQIAASKGVVLQANIFGKIKTVFQDVSLPLLVILNSGILQGTLRMIWWWVSLVLFSVAVILTIVSGVIYLVQNKKVFSN